MKNNYKVKFQFTSSRGKIASKTLLVCAANPEIAEQQAFHDLVNNFDPGAQITQTKITKIK